MPTVRVPLAPGIVSWAIRRAGLDQGDLHRSFPNIEGWDAGIEQPTLRQLETFASKVHVPLGYLLLPAPPVEPLPIPDFRTIEDEATTGGSVALLDTIYLCQQRQEWYRDHQLSIGGGAVPIVGAFAVDDDSMVAGERLRRELPFDVADRASISSWTESLRALIYRAEEMGVLVMKSGVVGNDSHRPLDVEEFRGFALSDSYAPLIFINGRDTIAAQAFTLVHELAHLCLGLTALDDASMERAAHGQIERWCNAVAAEVLAPRGSLIRDFRSGADLMPEVQRLARIFRTSTLMLLNRLRDLQLISPEMYREAYSEERARVMQLLANRDEGDGGNFYNTQTLRVSRRFAQAVMRSAQAGRVLQRDAYSLLGVKSTSTFRNFSEKLGVA